MPSGPWFPFVNFTSHLLICNDTLWYYSTAVLQCVSLISLKITKIVFPCFSRSLETPDVKAFNRTMSTWWNQTDRVLLARSFSVWLARCMKFYVIANGRMSECGCHTTATPPCAQLLFHVYQFNNNNNTYLNNLRELGHIVSLEAHFNTSMFPLRNRCARTKVLKGKEAGWPTYVHW